MAPTEGVDFLQLNRPILSRNIRASGIDPQSTTYPPSPADGNEASNLRLQRRFDNNRGKETLVMRIAVNNYVRIFQPATEESYYEDLVEREGSGEDDFVALAETRDRRDEMAKGAYARSHRYMKDFAQQDVEKLNVDFGKLVEEGVKGVQQAEPESMDVEQ